MTVGADPELQSAIRREARLTQLMARDERDSPSGIDAGPVSGLLRIHGDSDAQETSVGLAPLLPFAQRNETNSFSRLMQGSRIIAGIKMATCDVVERHLLRTN